MVEQELHQKVDEKIGKAVQVIKEMDPFLFDCMESIYDTLKNVPTPNLKELAQGPLSYTTEEETLLLVAEFLEKCDPSYKKRLLQDYKEGKIKFTDTKESGLKSNRSDLNNYEIQIHKTNTLMDSTVLVHEMFHALNLNNFYSRIPFTETVSIIAELMFQTFLEEKGYSDYDINLLKQQRAFLHTNNLLYLKMLFPLLIEKKNQGTISDNIYFELKEKNHQSEKSIKKNLTKLVSKKEENLDADTYQYVIGYILGQSIMHQNPSFQKLKMINEQLLHNEVIAFQETITGKYEMDELYQFVTKDDFSYKNKMVNQKRK